ncbi:MAG: hypothetical protein ACJ75J_17140 [Cytophagaceae bacterium]
MQELIKQISEKTGISPEQAKAAAESVKSYLTSKLPESLHGPLNSALDGAKVPDMFSDKLDTFKDRANEIKDQASDKLKDLGKDAKGMIDKLF